MIQARPVCQGEHRVRLYPFLGWINLDTSALAAQALGAYSGNPIPNEILVGQSSGARAKVKERKLITDPSGFIKGTFFIPDPSKATNPKF